MMMDLTNIPKEPGCYLFKDGSKIIYVGKAKDLRKRVKSYFTKTHSDPKTIALVKSIKEMEFIVTGSEVEALILENNLIKKHWPKYNINLKDSKRYAYLQITDEKFPRLMLARKRGKGRFYGPFTSAVVRDHIRTVLVKSFKIRTCKRFPKRACLRYHIGLCDAPCVGNILEKEYDENIRVVESVLKGKIKEISDVLKSRMQKASKAMDFEKAMTFRDQINSVEWLAEKQRMERDKKYEEDIINYVEHEGKIYLSLFNIHKGILENKQEYEFDASHDFLEDFILQYYSDNPVPKEIILSKKIGEALGRYLGKLKKGKVKVLVPQKGDKKHLLDLVKKNIEVTLFGDMEKLDDLQKKLRMNETPHVIECFDVSHLSGTSTVASMVQFRNARPDKSNYRRFKIRSVSGIDDFLAIAEVVRRRYLRLKSEDAQMPNLIIIDGGKGQLNAALAELGKLDLKIPIIGIAKKMEEIYTPGLSFPIILDRKGKALRLIQSIRDEAHRFAIKYNRLLHKKELVG